MPIIAREINRKINVNKIISLSALGQDESGGEYYPSYTSDYSYPSNEQQYPEQPVGVYQEQYPGESISNVSNEPVQEQSYVPSYTDYSSEYLPNEYNKYVPNGYVNVSEERAVNEVASLDFDPSNYNAVRESEPSVERSYTPIQNVSIPPIQQVSNIVVPREISTTESQSMISDSMYNSMSYIMPRDKVYNSVITNQAVSNEQQDRIQTPSQIVVPREISNTPVSSIIQGSNQIIRDSSGNLSVQNPAVAVSQGFRIESITTGYTPIPTVSYNQPISDQTVTQSVPVSSNTIPIVDTSPSAYSSKNIVTTQPIESKNKAVLSQSYSGAYNNCSGAWGCFKSIAATTLYKAAQIAESVAIGATGIFGVAGAAIAKGVGGGVQGGIASGTVIGAVRAKVMAYTPVNLAAKQIGFKNYQGFGKINSCPVCNNNHTIYSGYGYGVQQYSILNNNLPSMNNILTNYEFITQIGLFVAGIVVLNMMNKKR